MNVFLALVAIFAVIVVVVGIIGPRFTWWGWFIENLWWIASVLLVVFFIGFLVLGDARIG